MRLRVRFAGVLSNNNPWVGNDEKEDDFFNRIDKDIERVLAL